MSCGTLWRGYCFSNKIQMLLGSTINDAAINDAALKMESLLGVSSQYKACNKVLPSYKMSNWKELELLGG